MIIITKVTVTLKKFRWQYEKCVTQSIHEPRFPLSMCPPGVTQWQHVPFPYRNTQSLPYSFDFPDVLCCFLIWFFSFSFPFVFVMFSSYFFIILVYVFIINFLRFPAQYFFLYASFYLMFAFFFLLSFHLSNSFFFFALPFL